MAHLCTQFPHAVHGGGEIRLPSVGHFHSERGSISYCCCGTCSADDSLGWNAADIQAVSTHHFTLNQGDLCTQSGSSGGSHETGWARADHHQVVAAIRHGINVVCRGDFRLQFFIMCIKWLQLRKFGHC